MDADVKITAVDIYLTGLVIELVTSVEGPLVGAKVIDSLEMDLSLAIAIESGVPSKVSEQLVQGVQQLLADV